MNRFDDPRREFRTLYCAEQRRTCLLETLAPLRPNPKALREFEALFGELPAPPRIRSDWCRKNVLAPARVEVISGGLLDLDDLDLRRELELQHAGLLQRHGLDHLDITELRGRQRPVTQALARSLFDQGAAGIVFRSNLDDQLCVALFEGRSRLTAAGEPDALEQDLPDLLWTCKRFGLRFE